MYEMDAKYQKAAKRVARLRGFYVHLGVYIIVNLGLFLLNIIASPEQLWFFWPLCGWGIAIVLHGLSVHGSGRLFGAEWEEKKIREFIEE